MGRLDPLSVWLLTAAREGWLVVRLSDIDDGDFNLHLKKVLLARTGQRIVCGTFYRGDLKLSMESHYRFVAKAKSDIGWAAYSPVPAGYYLFHGNKLVSYHSGLAEGVSDGELAGAAIGGLTSLLFAGLFQSSDLLQVSAEQLSEPAGRRIYAQFDAVMTKVAIDDFLKLLLEAMATADAAKRAKDEQERQRAEEARTQQEAAIRAERAQELRNAYRTLSLAETASDKEVKTRHRKLQLEWHDDHSQVDISPDDRRRRLCVSQDINVAYELIMRSRKPPTPEG